MNISSSNWNKNLNSRKVIINKYKYETKTLKYPFI